MQTKQIYQILADLVLLFHFVIVVFIVLGLLLIIIGGVKNWRWIRNPWFRTAHLVAIGIVVVQAWLGNLCPLTYLENSLRQKADAAVYPGSFIGFWIQELLYYDFPFWVFTVLYTAFAVVVFICWLKFKPKEFKKSGNAQSANKLNNSQEPD